MLHQRYFALPLFCFASLVYRIVGFFSSLFLSFIVSLLHCFIGPKTSLDKRKYSCYYLSLQGVPALHTNTDILEHSDNFPHLRKDPEQVLQDEKKLCEYKRRKQERFLS